MSPFPGLMLACLYVCAASALHQKSLRLRRFLRAHNQDRRCLRWYWNCPDHSNKSLEKFHIVHLQLLTMSLVIVVGLSEGLFVSAGFKSKTKADSGWTKVKACTEVGLSI